MSGFFSAGSGGGVLAGRYSGDGTTAETVIAIPAGYSTLLFRMAVRTTEVVTASAVFLQFNGDTAANYDYEYMASNVNTTPTSAQTQAANQMYLGVGAGASAVTADVGVTEGYFPRYADTTFNKTGMSSSAFKTSNASGGISVRKTGLWWRSNAAITSARVFISTGNFATGSVIEAWVLP